MINSNSLFGGFFRTWRHHLGLQLTTLLVLCGTFAVVVVFSTFVNNLDSILTRWGDSVQMTAFLDSKISAEKVSEIQSSLKEMKEFSVVSYVSQEEAKKTFSRQMASYAPELVDDPEFSTAFPASFQLHLAQSNPLPDLGSLASRIRQWGGIESVSFGQDWVDNYSKLFRGFKQISIGIAIVLVIGGLLIIGNSIRVSITQRQDEIELLELVGATPWMIRKPFLFEGFLMGILASALAVTAGFFLVQVPSFLLHDQFHLFGVAAELKFLPLPAIFTIIIAGSFTGMAGAWFCLRDLNDGWSAKRRGIRG